MSYTLTNLLYKHKAVFRTLIHRYDALGLDTVDARRRKYGKADFERLMRLELDNLFLSQDLDDAVKQAETEVSALWYLIMSVDYPANDRPVPAKQVLLDLFKRHAHLSDLKFGQTRDELLASPRHDVKALAEAETFGYTKLIDLYDLLPGQH